MKFGYGNLTFCNDEVQRTMQVCRQSVACSDGMWPVAASALKDAHCIKTRITWQYERAHQPLGCHRAYFPFRSVRAGCPGEVQVQDSARQRGLLLDKVKSLSIRRLGTLKL